MATTPRVFIFDTTLRDGEQAPGCSMTISEKVRMAGKLAELGVDIMEAGFPIASTGDFEAVQAVSRALPVKVARARALHGRRTSSGRRRRWTRRRARRASTPSSPPATSTSSTS